MRHKPGVIYGFRKTGYPNGYVRTLDEDTLLIFYDENDNEENGQMMTMDRATARLLVKRINQCLEGTKFTKS